MSEPDYIEVALNPSELRHVAYIGVDRGVQNIVEGRPPRYGARPENQWDLGINGIYGEAVVAKLLNIYWTGNLGDYAAADVGKLQARTPNSHRKNLILHRTSEGGRKGDADDDVFILVTGLPPLWRVVGWIRGRDGKQEKWWADPTGEGRPAFFVPRSALHDMATLEGYPLNLA